jgi:hypothetical protein
MRKTIKVGKKLACTKKSMDRESEVEKMASRLLWDAQKSLREIAEQYRLPIAVVRRFYKGSTATSNDKHALELQQNLKQTLPQLLPRYGGYDDRLELGSWAGNTEGP